MRIRHCGFLANRCKKNNLLKCRNILGQDNIPEKSNKSIKELMLELTGQDISTCPFCKKGKLKKMYKIPEQTGPGFFERLNLTALQDTSQPENVLDMIFIYEYLRRWIAMSIIYNGIKKREILIEKSITILKKMVNYNMIDHKERFYLNKFFQHSQIQTLQSPQKGEIRL